MPNLAQGSASWQSAVPRQYQGEVQWAARQLRIDPAIVAYQLRTESGYNPGATSPAGAEGLAQFEPGTWAGLRCSGSPYDAQASFRCYVTYMSQLLGSYHGDVRKALAAYNAGPGNLQAGYGYADSILAQAGSPGARQSARGLSATIGGPGAAGSGGPDPDCLIGFSLGSSAGAAVAGAVGGVAGGLIPGLGGGGGGSSQVCLMRRSWARALAGGALMAAGGAAGVVGLAVLLAAALGRSGVAAKAGQAASSVPVPGAQAAAAGVASAQSKARRRGGQRQAGGRPSPSGTAPPPARQPRRTRGPTSRTSAPRPGSYRSPSGTAPPPAATGKGKAKPKGP